MKEGISIGISSQFEKFLDRICWSADVHTYTEQGERRPDSDIAADLGCSTEEMSDLLMAAAAQSGYRLKDVSKAFLELQSLLRPQTSENIDSPKLKSDLEISHQIVPLPGKPWDEELVITIDNAIWRFPEE